MRRLMSGGAAWGGVRATGGGVVSDNNGWLVDSSDRVGLEVMLLLPEVVDVFFLAEEE